MGNKRTRGRLGNHELREQGKEQTRLPTVCVGGQEHGALACPWSSAVPLPSNSAPDIVGLDLCCNQAYFFKVARPQGLPIPSCSIALKGLSGTGRNSLSLLQSSAELKASGVPPLGWAHRHYSSVQHLAEAPVDVRENSPSPPLPPPSTQTKPTRIQPCSI